MKFKIYTDGSCKNNGKDSNCGGWGYAIVRDGILVVDASGAERNTTNQRMELMACAFALTDEDTTLEIARGNTVTIYTDSAYLYNCWEQKWYKNWTKNGWHNAKKQPIANRELWECLIPFFENSLIHFEKVSAHTGISEDEKWNNYVDKLAQGTAQELEMEASI